MASHNRSYNPEDIRFPDQHITTSNLVDEMEKRGIITPKDGAKPRMCLISREEFEAMKATGELD